jgi:hypothetical protein
MVEVRVDASEGATACFRLGNKWTWRILSNLPTVGASAWYCVGENRENRGLKNHNWRTITRLADPHGDVTFKATQCPLFPETS